MQAGFELDIVISLFKQLHVEQSDNNGVLSVFALPSRPSLVYIEAPSFQALTSLFHSYDGNPLYPGVLWYEVPHIIPLNERLNSLISLPPLHSFPVPSFIRVNEPRSLYNGDICFVIHKEEFPWVMVTLVPHIDFLGTGIHPKAKLFNPNNYPGEVFHSEDDGSIHWESCDEDYYHGFLLVSYRMTSLAALFVRDPHSSLLCPTIDFDDRLLAVYNDTGYECTGTDLSDLLLAVCRFRSQSHISVGSLIRVFAGDYEGCIRDVKNIQEPYALVMLSHDGGQISVSVPIARMVLEVKISDYVEVFTGHHKGCTSLVIDRITVSGTPGAEQLVVVVKETLNQVQKHSPSFTLLDF